MKSIGSALGITFALSAVAALPVHGDILTETSPFTRSGNPNYSAEGSDTAGLEDPRYAPMSPGDSDLGVQEILSETPDKAPINLSLGFDLHYTDNAPADAFGATAEGSYLTAAYFGISWQPLIGNGWFADLGLSQEFYEFEDDSALDFENFSPHVGVVKNLVFLDDTIFFARYEYQRITTGSFDNGDYHAQRLRAGLQKTLFSTPRQQLSAGISAAFDIDAGPEALERDEYALELSYSYAITHKLSANLMARSAIWNFDEGGRDDSVHIAGLELVYNLRENASISAGVYYTNNDSNTALGVNDSESWQGGLSVGMNYSF